jgi:hypothetical protein
MFAEKAIFVQQRRLHESRRDTIERREDAIFFVATQSHPELVTVAIEDAPGKADVFHERRSRQAKPNPSEGPDSHKKRGE